MTKQPDLLENNGTEIIIKYLEQSTESELKRLVLKWTKECCVMHEMNRYILYTYINLLLQCIIYIHFIGSVFSMQILLISLRNY